MNKKIVQCPDCGKCFSAEIDWANNVLDRVIYDYFERNFVLNDIDGTTHRFISGITGIRHIIFETKFYNEPWPDQAQLRMLYIHKTDIYRDRELSLRANISPLYDEKSTLYLIKLPDKRQFDDEGREVLYKLKPDDKLELFDIVSNEQNKFIVPFEDYSTEYLKTVSVIEFVELISGIKNNLKECYKNNF